MIRQIKKVEINNVIANVKKQYGKVNVVAVAAVIRHDYTNYDEVAKYLSTDKAEQLIIETYKTVVSINSATAPAMKAWAQAKMRTIA